VCPLTGFPFRLRGKDILGLDENRHSVLRGFWPDEFDNSRTPAAIVSRWNHCLMMQELHRLI
jgi:hypothetical protein